MLAIIDVDDDLFEDYENFFIEYDLRAERKNENFIESIKFVEDCRLIPIPKKDFIDEAEFYQTKEEYIAYVEGWTDCLGEILSHANDILYK